MDENYLIVGLGSIGKRHLETVSVVAPEARIVVLRRPQSPPDAAGAGATVVHDLDDALALGIKAAIVAGPATTHVATALQLARAGVHCLVEKPLSDGLEGVDALLELCNRNNLVLQTGYCLRFDPALAAIHEAVEKGAIGRILGIQASVGQYLPDWRPGSDYRTGVSARRDLGGGVLLELSHEIDILRWLGGEVVCVAARLGCHGGLDIDVEDTADLLLTFKTGITGTLHMDMVQRSARRKCVIAGANGTLVWDGIRGRADHYDAASGRWRALFDGDQAHRGEYFQEQFRHFLHCIETGGQPLVSGRDGRRVVEIVLAARRSDAEQRTVGL